MKYNVLITAGHELDCNAKLRMNLMVLCYG